MPPVTGDTATPVRGLLIGSCLDRLRELPDASIDAVVTDPPYGLSNVSTSTIVQAVTQWATGDREFIPDARGFMGKAWDAFVPPPAVWDECLRVLKPGGHLLAFAGSRTFDLMGLSIRFAGFEVRDSVAWLYGSGFPKSLDVSKAIDKRRDDQEEIRKVCRWLRKRMEEAKITAPQIANHFGFHSRMVEHWAARDTDSQPTLPTLSQWDALRELIGFSNEMDQEVYRLNTRKGQPGEAWNHRPVTGKADEWRNRTNYALTSRDGLCRDIPATEDAKRWQGWGTALKPAFEPIVVARKPLDGTVARNVVAHGTGALNIDACRIGDDDGERWPSNVMLDQHAARTLDQQEPDTARFFYVAKTSTAERNAGNTPNHHPTVKPLTLMRELVRLVTPPGGVILDPFLGSGTTACAAILEGFDWIGCELTPDYIPIIEARTAWAQREHDTQPIPLFDTTPHTRSQLTIDDQPTLL